MKRVFSSIAAFVVVWVLALGAAAHAGLRFNASPSAPPGIYWMSAATPSLGDYVIVCPPPTPLLRRGLLRGYFPPGFCPGGLGELIKVLAARRGDHVAVGTAGVVINGHRWPLTTQRPSDALGRPLPKLRMQRLLTRNEVFVLSDRCAIGFDSRYFGPLHARSIEGTARPLFLWRDY